MAWRCCSTIDTLAPCRRASERILDFPQPIWDMRAAMKPLCIAALVNTIAPCDDLPREKENVTP
jgi:hypothetical protein